MSVISSMKKSKATTPHPAPGGTDLLRSHLGCLRFALLFLPLQEEKCVGYPKKVCTGV